MAGTNNIFVKALVLLNAVFLFSVIRSQNAFDSLKVALPKHYFQTVIVADVYRKPDRNIKDTSDAIGRRLKSYGVKQFNFSFYTPLFTSESYNKSGGIKNSHWLLTGNYMLLQPVFTGLEQHNLVKLGVGLRYIFNSGKKGVWFADVSPFITKDVSYASKGYLRLASTFVYSHNVSESFNWRLGITKSFMWGNRFYLPFIGLRFGRLDKVNLSIQFPRSINFNVPVNSKLILSLYTAPQGGMYNFANSDSLYLYKSDKTFHFTRYEINSGFRMDVRTGANFNFYIAAGLSTRNNVTFYSERANRARPRAAYSSYFYSEKIGATLFFNAGIVLRFGKTRSYYNNKNIYDAIDLNNSGNGNAQIPVPQKQRKADQNLKSIQDLMDYNDF